jgi:hypothetical protein
MKILLALSLLPLLAACASAPSQPAGAASPADGAATAGPDGRPLTGSRLSRETTDRTLRRIGNQTFRQDEAQNIRSINNDVGARSN